MNRRTFCTLAGTAVAAPLQAEPASEFKLNYIMSSAMYGTTPLAEVLPEVAKTGSTAIDIWPRPHANHREQIAEMLQRRCRSGGSWRHAITPARRRAQGELLGLERLGKVRRWPDDGQT